MGEYKPKISYDENGRPTKEKSLRYTDVDDYKNKLNDNVYSSDETESKIKSNIKNINNDNSGKLYYFLAILCYFIGIFGFFLAIFILTRESNSERLKKAKKIAVWSIITNAIFFLINIFLGFKLSSFGL